MPIPLQVNGTTYDFPEPGETDWRDGATRWAEAITDAVAGVQTGNLVTPVYNVRNYGATGNGVTDDTAAIASAQAALALTGLAGGTLYFPAGDYKVSSTMQFGVSTPQANVRITGDGASSRILQYGSFSTTPLIEFRNVNGWTTSDIVLDGSDNAGTGDLVLVDGSNGGNALRTSFENSQRYGLNVTLVNGTGYPVGNGVSLCTYLNNATANVFGVIEGSYVVNVRDYGAVGDVDNVDDTAAFQAAIDALTKHQYGFSDQYSRVLYIPTGRYRITATLQFPATYGLHIIGGGFVNTMLMWFGAAGDKFININSSSRLIVEGFSLWGNASAKPSYMLYFDYDPIVFATSGVVIRDVLMDGVADDDVYDYGIGWSDGYGNGSEVIYQNVFVNKFSETGVYLPGSQQKCHIFYGCHFNGAWNGTYGSGQGGKYCVTPSGSGGSYQFIGGSVSSVSEAAFGYASNDPVIIQGVQSENCYRFVGGPSTTANAGVVAVTITGCRCDNINDFDPAGYIKFYGLGPFIFEGNSINTDVTAGPWIWLGCSLPNMSCRITNNIFLTQDSADYQPIINGSVFDLGGVEIADNVYFTGGALYTRATRADFLWHNYITPNYVGLTRGQYNYRSGQLMLGMDYTSFTAAATTQTRKIFELPRGTKIKGMYVYLFDRFRGGTVATAHLDVGYTASGTEYLTTLDVWSLNQQFFGNTGADLGAALTGAVQGGYFPNYFATTDIYATMTTTAGNVNTCTTGLLFIILDLEVFQRLVPGT